MYRHSRLENERLRDSDRFLKVWEYRPEKRNLFEAVSVLYMYKNSRVYSQSSLKVNMEVR